MQPRSLLTFFTRRQGYAAQILTHLLYQKAELCSPDPYSPSLPEGRAMQPRSLLTFFTRRQSYAAQILTHLLYQKAGLCSPDLWGLFPPTLEQCVKCPWRGGNWQDKGRQGYAGVSREVQKNLMYVRRTEQHKMKVSDPSVCACVCDISLLLPLLLACTSDLILVCGVICVWHLTAPVARTLVQKVRDIKSFCM